MVKEYKPRLVDEKIDLYLSTFGAVCIEGPKWCGKTTTAEHHCKSAVSLDDPSNNYSNRSLAQIAPNAILETNGQEPKMIDEFQLVPGIWDAARYMADHTPGYGHWILTGSSIPDDESYCHSGVGRIGKLRMLSMSLLESGDSSGKVSLEQLFDPDYLRIPVTNRKTDIAQIIDYCVRGGWPLSIGEPLEIAKERPRQYIDATVNKDVYVLGGSKNKKDSYKIFSLIEAIAKHETEAFALTDIDDYLSKYKEIKLSHPTMTKYFDIFTRLYLMEYLPAFIPEKGSTYRVLSSPKRRFVDPSLVFAALGKEPEMLYNDIPTLTALFDSLCLRDLKIYSEAIRAKIFYYKDGYGLSADAVIRLKDNRWGAFKFVFAMHDIDAAAKELLKIKKAFSQTDDPALLCVVSAMAEAAYIREDGVKVVPITALKP